MDMKHEQIPDLRQLLRALPGADVPAMHLTVLADGPLTPQQITAAFLDSLIPAVTDSGDVDRDPYEQLRFAKRLMDRQGELLQVCWDMRERLEQARDYVSPAPAWQTLIEQLVDMTAQLQRLADRIRDLAQQLAGRAKTLIAQMEETAK